MNVSRWSNANAIFRSRTWRRIVDSATSTSGISARIRHQIRCAVCRCFRGAFLSASRTASMKAIAGSSFGLSRTGVLRSTGTALSTASRTIRR